MVNLQTLHHSIHHPDHVYRMGDSDTFPTITDQVGSADQTMTNMASSNFVTDTP